MPAEWEPHEATWLAWPHEKSDWPGKFAPIPWLYGEIVRHLARVERVRILVQDRDAEEGVRKILKKCHAELDAVEFFHHPTNRSWTRDYCPLFVKSKAGEVAATHWRFNGWAKYDNCRDDARTPAFIARKLKLQRIETGLVLEGGSIDVNGAGKLLTTEECLLSDVQARNPGLGRRELRAGVSRLSGHRRSHLAEPRHRRRRHAWPHRRSGSLHRRRFGDHGGRARQVGRESRAASRRIWSACAPARICASPRCPCPSRCTSPASGCPRATRTSISPTSWCWCRRSATRTTRRRCARWKGCSAIGPWSASPAAIWFWAWERCTA